MASRAPSKLLVTKIGGLLDCLDYQFQIFPPISHAMLHPWQILGQGFCMISGLFPSWCIHDYRQKSTVQSPESNKIVQKNTPKLTTEPLLLWIYKSPESWVQNYGLLDCSLVQAVQFRQTVHNHESSACRKAISWDKWEFRAMSPQLWICERVLSSVNQFRIISSLLAVWLFLWIFWNEIVRLPFFSSWLECRVYYTQYSKVYRQVV